MSDEAMNQHTLLYILSFKWWIWCKNNETKVKMNYKLCESDIENIWQIKNNKKDDNVFINSL